MPETYPELTGRAITSLRGPKAAVSERIPYAFFVEPEATIDRGIVDVATVFLTNRECPFRCTMCDLWINTTDHSVSVGAIPEQIRFALERLPPARNLKLYNSGNFFDAKAIPPEDRAAIAEIASGFSTLIVENHPKLCSPACRDFADLLEPELEIAVGLETCDPVTLAKLNKGMTLDDYQRSIELLLQSGIHVRTFILLKPPYVDEEAGVQWAIRSIKYAFALGVRCCSVVPTRAGNGFMDRLQELHHFSPPTLASMEAVLEAGLAMNRGLVFMDLWDAEGRYACEPRGPVRIERLRQMNLRQTYLPPVL